ncbi:MAG: CHAT domain-containing protein [Deltaproteobacteria bacterium]|nr:CHAT domain-containing protein [Deltaproteobacteria bacterium]
MIRPDAVVRDGGFWLPGAETPTGVPLPPSQVNPRGVRVDLRRCELVLSGACSGGRGAEAHGAEAMGLLRAFLANGVPAIVACAWDVPLPHRGAEHADAVMVLWTALMKRLVEPGGGGHTVRAAVRSARGAVEDYPALHSRYLVLHGDGTAPSPWAIVSPTASRSGHS